MQQVARFLADNSDSFVDALKQFLRIPSVSASSAHRGDVRRAAEFVRDQLLGAGLSVRVVETEGHPIVHGSWLEAKGDPTVLVYGHYDVQPPDPLNEWISPPFEPTVRDGRLFARGATDDKGQLFTHLKSLEAWMKCTGRLPVNVHVVIEGEEEVGSTSLDRFLEENREQLRCDVAVISDTSQFGPNMPAITYGLRGIVACEVTLRGPNWDLHSGVFGGAVANPINVLAKLIGALHDDRGRVTVPGFYDDVVPLAAAEHDRLEKLPFDEADFVRSLGVTAIHGEAGFSTNERRWCRPTCDVNGILGGYQGEGPKTIIPSKATAKITCRLVPKQDPEKIIHGLRTHFERLSPSSVKLEFQTFHGCPAHVFDPTSPYMSAAKTAIRSAFDVEPMYIREGGSIPVVGSLKQILRVDTLLLGWGQNTDNLHGPNEHFSLADFRRGTLASAHLWHELSCAGAMDR
jgi:acetylornithine deacetylase/succinyl-diaminopimelate desuccinylase-like protein